MKHLKYIAAAVLALVITFAISLPSLPARAFGENIIIDKTIGVPTQEITISGSGFSTGTGGQTYAVDIHFGRNPGTTLVRATGRYTTLKTQSINANGTFSTTVLVPSVLDGGTFEVLTSGSYYFFVTYRILPLGTTETVIDTVVFSLLTGDLTVSPGSGQAGTEVTMSGAGFTALENLVIQYDETEILSATAGGTAMANGSAINVKTFIPSSTAGVHSITITGQSSGHRIGNVFTVRPALEFRPEQGIASAEIDMYGIGFGPTSPINVTFNGVVFYSGTTEANGSFSNNNTPFPPGTFQKGTYMVVGTDSLGNTAQVTYIIADAQVTMEPEAGSPGWDVMVTGEGFQANKKVTISFENIAANYNVSTTTNANGDFSTVFTVLWPTEGTYDVEITDGTFSKTLEFEVNTSSSIKPLTSSSEPGYVGLPMAVAGAGFTPNKTISVTLSGVQIGTGKADSTGKFNVQFTAPSTDGGQHVIEATDGSHTMRYGFVMEDESPAAPVAVAPAANVKAKSETFFDWEDVTDVSGVTYTLQVSTDPNFAAASIVMEKTGLSLSEYTILQTEKLSAVAKDTPYYWRVKATDYAFNDSLWTAASPFFLSFGFSLPQWAIYVIIIGAALALAAFTFWLGRKTAYY